MEQDNIEFTLEVFYKGELFKKYENVKTSDVIQHIISSEHNITERAVSQILKDRNKQELNVMKRYFIPESDFKVHKFFEVNLTRTK